MKEKMQAFWQWAGALNFWMWAPVGLLLLLVGTIFWYVSLAAGVFFVFTNHYEAGNPLELSEHEQNRMLMTLLLIAPYFSIGALLAKQWQIERT